MITARVPLAASILALLLLQGLPAQAQFGGLKPSVDRVDSSARWSARIESASPLAAQPRLDTPMWLWPSGRQSFGVLGDYQFDTLRLGETGGLRLTGGVLLSLRPTAGLFALPTMGSNWLLSGAGFAGVGYATGSADGQWGFSADVGLTGLDFGPTEGLRSNAAGRLADFRLAPLVRMGVRWSF